jgi:serine/threonine protein phosphatase PrpC
LSLGKRKKELPPGRFEELLRAALALLPKRSLSFIQALLDLVASFIDSEKSPTKNDIRSLAATLTPLILRPFDELSGDPKNYEARVEIVRSLLEDPGLAKRVKEGDAQLAPALDVLRTQARDDDPELARRVLVGVGGLDSGCHPISKQSLGADRSHSLFGLVDGRGSQQAAEMVSESVQSTFAELASSSVCSNPEALLRKLFKMVDSAYRKDCTATLRGHGVSLALAWIYRPANGKSWIHFANAGDVVGTLHFDTVHCARISRTHTARQAAELARLSSLGAQLDPHEVTRGLGFTDTSVRSSVPACKSVQLVDQERIIFSTAGVVDALSDAVVAKLARNGHKRALEVGNTAQQICDHALQSSLSNVSQKTTALLIAELPNMGNGGRPIKV